MSELIQFTKMHGLGNDFVVIDAISQNIKLLKSQIIFLADRHIGIGCDQILLVEKTTCSDCDFFYRIYNADGSEAGQCGNGARCIAKFIYDKNLSSKTVFSLKTISSRLEVHLRNDLVRVNMGLPSDISRKEKSIALSLGNPHIVFTIDDIQDKTLNNCGLEDINVGFMQIINRNHIKLRVFERGVGETKACGSGACAAVVAGIIQHLLDFAVTVELPGGKLYIEWQGENYSVWMSGPAKTVFEGTVNLFHI